MGKRRPTARSASSSRRGRSPISMASEEVRDVSLRPNSHPDRNLRPCKTMHPIGVKSQRRPDRVPHDFPCHQPPRSAASGVRQIVGQRSRKPIGTAKADTGNRLRRPSASLGQVVEDEGMLRVPPYNSKKEAFHHANSKCGLGLRIAPHNRVSGTGNKPLCKNCKKLNDQGGSESAVMAERATRSK